MEDIQESICEMSEIMQSYASRGFSAEEAFWSALCHRRQSEAELAIALASQRLEVGQPLFVDYRERRRRGISPRPTFKARLLHIQN